MSKLRWDKDTDRLFEAGIDRGVLYELDDDHTYVGVAWNGITSVEEHNNSSVTPIYFDSQKQFDMYAPGDFSASLKAYTYPDEFLKFEGMIEDSATGLLLDNQPVDTFGLSYRTLIGNPDKSTDFEYKIHILYNVTAIPDAVTRQTLSANVDPIEFSWSLSCIPEEVVNFRPTAHIVVDTRKVSRAKVSEIEFALYGGPDSPIDLPYLPSAQDVVTILSS